MGINNNFILRKYALLIISLILFLFAAYAFESQQYPYYKKIIVQQINEPVIVNLDNQVLSYMKADGTDLRITEDGNEVALKTIITKAEELAHKRADLAASSIRPEFRGVNFDPSNLIDGDYSNNDNSYFQIDAIKDPNYAWFKIGLEDEILTDKVKIWSLNPDYTWTEIQIEGSNDNNKWDIIKSKTKYDVADIRTVSYPPVQYKYLKFSFWHTQSLVINEIELYGAYAGKAVFFARSGKNYRLYYGNMQATATSYDISQLFTKKTTPIVVLGQQEQIKDYKFDTDADGILSDNCPTISNPDQKDSDNDGIGDKCDNCMQEANADQKDSDNDGVGDSCDNCYLTFNPDQYDDNLNSKGYVCDDNDNDGIINSVDNCLQTPNRDQNDKDRNGIGDACEDIDNDNIPFSKDNCINKNNPDQKDSDKDRIGDECDNCVLGSNSNQFDKDNDGIGDVCEDEDNDDVANFMDNCVNKPNADQKNNDEDSFGDVCDNCPSIKNNEQSDNDNNGIGDICDDADKDGLINAKDNCPNIANQKQDDQNNNGIGDACEDFDNDNVLNAEDNCVYESNPRQYVGNEFKQLDADKDGVGDMCDKEDDRLTEKKWLVWLVIIATVLIVGILGWRLSKKPINKN